MLPSAAAASETSIRVPEQITINIQESCAPLREEVGKDNKEVRSFSHALHATRYLKGKNAYATSPFTDDFTCAACHLGAGSAEEIGKQEKCERLTTMITANGGGKQYKKLMHGICIDCHKNAAKAGEQAGPSACSSCHAKK